MGCSPTDFSSAATIATIEFRLGPQLDMDPHILRNRRHVQGLHIRVVHEEKLIMAGQLRVWFDRYQTFPDEMDEVAFAARNTAIAGPMASRGHSITR